MAMKPSEIRAMILGDHAELRALLRDIDANLDRADDPLARTRLPEQLTHFYAAFLRHIEHEEQILEPVLADIDNWGPVRIERMDAEHAEQRAQIGRLSSLRPSPDVRSYVEQIRSFLRAIRADMDEEERECLNPNVLRDDTINIDSFGG